MKSKFVTKLMIQDPDTQLFVEVEIRKLESGLMVGLDGWYLSCIEDGDIVYSPYNSTEQIEISSEEQRCT